MMPHWLQGRKQNPVCIHLMYVKTFQRFALQNMSSAQWYLKNPLVIRFWPLTSVKKKKENISKEAWLVSFSVASISHLDAAIMGGILAMEKPCFRLTAVELKTHNSQRSNLKEGSLHRRAELKPKTQGNLKVSRPGMSSKLTPKNLSFASLKLKKNLI